MKEVNALPEDPRLMEFERPQRQREGEAARSQTAWRDCDPG